MAVDKLVDSTQLDSDLTSVANAIRTKGGTSASLAFPDGFVTAIGNIPTGGGSTLITKSISANGTYNASSDNADGYSSVSVAVPVKLVTGTFTGTTTGASMDVSIPYTGNGYPIAGIIYPKDGAWKDGSTIATTVQRYAVTWVTFVKDDFSSTPNYSSATEINNGELYVQYKNSDSDATVLSYGGKNHKNIYYNSNASSYSDSFVRIRGNTTMAVYIASTSYGFMNNVEYEYLILYSE